MKTLDNTVSRSSSFEGNNSLIFSSRNLDYQKISSSLVTQLREYLEKSNQNGYVVGVSGGVDSALVSTLCAMTGKPFLAVEMPIHQSSAEVTRAQEHIKWLKAIFPNVASERTDLTPVFEVMKKTVEAACPNQDIYLSLVNTRSRLRMSMLYALAGAHRYLVAGTGNKVEDYGIGFFTKYGDGGVDISPIGMLYKSEVREMARYLGVSDAILQAAPTDGLHPTGATDEDQIGATYDELEGAMVEYDAGKRVQDFSGRARDVIEIYTKRHLVNAHKMAMPPVLSITD